MLLAFFRRLAEKIAGNIFLRNLTTNRGWAFAPSLLLYKTTKGLMPLLAFQVMAEPR
jgi:hypothetical protein